MEPDNEQLGETFRYELETAITEQSKNEKGRHRGHLR